MYDLLNDLSKRVWITRGCRFNAQRRMEINDKYANLTISILTVFIIAINLLVYHPFFSTKGNIITILTVSLSVFVLTISQFVYARDYKIKAQIYHGCGCALSNVLDRIDILKKNESIKDENIAELYKEYEDIIIRYNENHNYIDYEMFRVMNKNIKNNGSNNPNDILFKLSSFKSFRIRLKWYSMLYFRYILLGLILPFTSIFILIYF